MEKVRLLLNEFQTIKMKNLIKFIIMEIILICLITGSIFMNVDIKIKIIIFCGLIFIFIMGFILYIKKQKAITFCMNYYQKRTLDVINSLENRKTYFLDLFDFTNEKLIFKEILRTLKIYDKYHDKSKIGHWEILYNHQKTKSFYDKLVLKDKPSIKKVLKNIENISKEVQTLLKNIGIDYHKVYDIWERKIGGKTDTYELMYPVFGLILNDSQVLSHRRYQVYQIDENSSIKPYERQLDDEDVIMLHIKIQL